MLWQMHENGAGPISPGIAFKMLQLVKNDDITLTGKDDSMARNSFDLTQREQEILTLLVQGLLYKEIGAELGISPNTAKKHVINIYNKLHVNSRAQAIIIVHKKKWL